MMSCRILPLALPVAFPLVIALLLVAGCRSTANMDLATAQFEQESQLETTSYDLKLCAAEIAYPVVEKYNQSPSEWTPPDTIRHPSERVPWPLTLQETIELTLANSRVIRELGGTLLETPEGLASKYDVALQDANAIRGTHAALSEFDAQFTTSLFLGNVESRSRTNGVLNPSNAGSRFGILNLAISKTAATGTRFSLGNVTEYQRPRGIGNFQSHIWDTAVAAEVRHPLLRGAGIQFNRIAGPNAIPGRYRGLLLARLNTDIELAEFETAVRNLLWQVENAYWRLHLAYRIVDAETKGRDIALEVWRVVKTQYEMGEADREQEALARERYFAAQIALQNAISGMPRVMATARPTEIAVAGFAGGLLASERKLRYLMGIPVSDGRLIFPADKLTRIDVVFDRQESEAMAQERRIEVRRQKTQVRRRELELIAARNFVRPQLDLVGRYGLSGYGDELLAGTRQARPNRFTDLFGDGLDDWHMGFEFSMPIGNRIGHVAVHHAKLGLARQQSLMKEQKLRVTHELTAAFAELDRAFMISRSNVDRRVAAAERTEAVRAKYDIGEVSLNIVLDAERRSVEADVAFFQSVVDYNLALTNVHLARGTFLEYANVSLAETSFSRQSKLARKKEIRAIRIPVLAAPELSESGEPTPFKQTSTTR